MFNFPYFVFDSNIIKNILGYVYNLLNSIVIFNYDSGVLHAGFTMWDLFVGGVAIELAIETLIVLLGGEVGHVYEF